MTKVAKSRDQFFQFSMAGLCWLEGEVDEPLLHKVNAKHGVQRKRGPTGLALWVVRRNQLTLGGAMQIPL